jgi:uncharacterized protein (TIGR03437 family)
VISIYATGTGVAADGAPGLTRSIWFVDPVQEGITADVLEARAAPEVTGLLQLKVKAPVDVTPGASVPFALQIGGDAAEFASLAIR